MSNVGGIDSLAFRDFYGTARMRAVFDDHARLQAMLDVEAAMAHAEAELGIIPRKAAKAIAKACKADLYDMAAMGPQVPLGGNLAIPVVKALTAGVAGDAAGYVHWGATSQDIIDTGLMLQMRAGLDVLIGAVAEVASGAARLADTHRRSMMPGRTLMQHALPMPFGLKAAVWLGLATRSHERLRRARQESLALQFGGAVGTLAALGEKGFAVAGGMAKALHLPLPPTPWFTARDRIAEIGSSVAITAGAMAKIATDIAFLSQTEIGEVAEPSAPGKGGSSTMPHKRNPVGAAAAIASAVQAEGRFPILLAAMRQEHERSVGLWAAEWPAIAELFVLTDGATAPVAAMLSGLEVDTKRMRANIGLTQGLVYAEAASFALAEKLGKAAAHKAIEEASRKAVKSGKHLREILAGDPALAKQLPAKRLDAVFDPAGQIGSSDAFIDRALAAWEEAKSAS